MYVVRLENFLTTLSLIVYSTSSILSLDIGNNPKLTDQYQLNPKKDYIRLVRNLTNVTGYVGQRAKFLCDIVGRPKPSITWTKDLLPLIEIPQKIRISMELWGSQIRIDDLDFSDEGWYTCDGANKFGSINTTAYLHVLQPKKRQPQKQETNNAQIKTDNKDDTSSYCQAFQSSTCGHYLSGYKIFVKSILTQSEKERTVANLITEISLTLAQLSDQECVKHIIRLTCHYHFLMCDDNNKAKQVCQQQCHDVTALRCKYTYGLLMEKLKEEYLVSIPKCNKLPSEPACFKYDERSSTPVRQQPPAMEIDCYNGTGNDYSGTVSRTIHGLPCIEWKNIPEFKHMASLDANYCRNPKLENAQHPSGPWCYTNLSGEWGMCPIRRCTDSSSTPITRNTGNLLPIYIAVSSVVGFIILLLLICWVCKRSKLVANAHNGGIGRKSYLGIYKPCQIDLKKSDSHLVQLSKMKINCNEYSLSQIRFQEQIGEGIFGPVYKAELTGANNNPTNNTSSTNVIVKTLSAGSSVNLQRDFKREAQLMSELKHVNVLSMVGVSMRQIPWCLLFDYMERGDLHELIVSCSTVEARSMSTVRADSMDAYGDVTLTYSDQIFIAAQIASGMEYLSSQSFVHRDLAARNVLIGENIMCKISDIGLVKDCYSSDYYRTPGSSLMLPIRWMSPEAIAYGRFTVESDVWAFGVLLWEVWSNGLQPFYGHSNTEVMELIRSRQILPCPENCPAKVYDLMLECWNEMPRYRPVFKNIHGRIRGWQQEVVEVNQNIIAAAGSARSGSHSGGSKHTTSSTEMCSDHSHLLTGYSPVTCQSGGSQEQSLKNGIINTISFNQPYDAPPPVIGGPNGPFHFSRIPNNNTVYLPELSHIV